jgi:hypothetical protein
MRMHGERWQEYEKRRQVKALGPYVSPEKAVLIPATCRCAAHEYPHYHEGKGAWEYVYEDDKKEAA